MIDDDNGMFLAILTTGFISVLTIAIVLTLAVAIITA